jgi:phytoene synthase
MSDADAPSDTLTAEHALALGYTPERWRRALRAYFTLDQRLARIVAQSSEPMLAQMRLAWWREMLAKPAQERPKGDAALDAVGEHWLGEEAPLIALVDGWEHLLGEEPLSPEQIRQFASGRTAVFGHIQTLLSQNADRTRAETAARRWALADCASHLPKGAERDAVLAEARSVASNPAKLHRDLRGLAILDALARRSLAHSGAPLMQGRGASITILRASILGK